MGIDASITSGTCQVLVLTVWDVEMSLRVTVLLGQPKVNDIHLVSPLADPHQEVIWFDVAMDEGFRVDVLDSGDELIGEEQHRLQRELSVAEVE